MNCEHKFIYQGVKYDFSEYTRPGSGAYTRRYYDFYFCEKCLEKRYEQLNVEQSSYELVLFGATSK